MVFHSKERYSVSLIEVGLWLKSLLFFVFIFLAFFLRTSNVFADGPLKMQVEDKDLKFRIDADSAKNPSFVPEINSGFCKATIDGVFRNFNCLKKNLKDLSQTESNYVINWQGERGATLANFWKSTNKDGSTNVIKTISTNLRDYYRACIQTAEDIAAKREMSCYMVTPLVCSAFEREVAKLKTAGIDASMMDSAYGLVEARLKAAIKEFNSSAFANEISFDSIAPKKRYETNGRKIPGEFLCQEFKKMAGHPKYYQFPTALEAAQGGVGDGKINSGTTVVPKR